MSEVNDKFIKRVKEDMHKSGFPLEIEVSSVLEKFGWNVQNQSFYLDEEENKPRSIDIFASKVLKVVTSKYFDYFNIYLVIECKKNQKPWLFYTTQSSLKKNLALIYVKGFSDPELAKNKDNSKELFKLTIDLFSESHYFLPNYNRDGIIPYEPFTDGKGRQIFTALNQVTKAIKYKLESFEHLYTKIPDINPFIVAYPLIIFDGRLLECRLEEGDFKIYETNYVRYMAQEATANYIIEIINKDFLKDYLKMLNHEINVMGNRFT